MVNINNDKLRTALDKLVPARSPASLKIQNLIIYVVSLKPGFALNIVCIIRNLAFYYRDKYKRTDLVVPIIFSVCMAAASVFSWEGTHTLLITAGLVVNTMCMGMFGAKNFRKTILISSSLILLYNIFASSYSGMVSESISLISAIIGIIRYRGNTKPEDAKETTAE